MTRPYLDVARPFVGDEEWQALLEPIRSGWLTQGPKVAEFESAFAARHHVEHAVAVTSCTTGLHVVLSALGVGPGDEVIVPAFTWIATANVVVHCGARPVFVDVDPVTYNIDVSRIASAVTERTKAVIPVHLFGLCADMAAVAEAVPERVLIVEDAACATGASLSGRPAGSLGLAGVFSLHPRKVITTGEGGMITTSDGDLADTVRRLRNHGARVAEEDRHRGPAPWAMPAFDDLGFNYRMTDLQGAVGTVQLGRLDDLLERRREIARAYSEGLASIDWIRVPQVPHGAEHAWQSYVVDVSAPASEVMEKLQQRGIASRPGTHSVPSLGWYRTHAATDPSDFPVATRLAATTVALPLHNHLEDSDVERVTDELGRI